MVEYTNFLTRSNLKNLQNIFFSKFDLTLLQSYNIIFLPLNDEPVHTFTTLLLRPMLIKVLLSTLMYQIEVQGGIALHVYIPVLYTVVL